MQFCFHLSAKKITCVQCGRQAHAQKLSSCPCSQNTSMHACSHTHTHAGTHAHPLVNSLAEMCSRTQACTGKRTHACKWSPTHTHTHTRTGKAQTKGRHSNEARTANRDSTAHSDNALSPGSHLRAHWALHAICLLVGANQVLIQAILLILGGNKQQANMMTTSTMRERCS